MRSLTLALVFAAALPAFGAEPVQVQLDVVVLSGPQSMFGQPQVKFCLPKEMKPATQAVWSEGACMPWFKVLPGEVKPAGVMDSANVKSLIHGAIEYGGAKILAEPKLVTLSGRPAHFKSGGQVAVPSANATAVDMRDVGTELDFLPIVVANGRIYLETSMTVRSVEQSTGVKTAGGLVPSFNERSLRIAFELSAGQSVLVSHRGANDSTLVVLTPKVITSQPATIPAAVQPASMPVTVAGGDHGKNVAAMLVREYQQACGANNAELAAKLARMALELDPMCFRVSRRPAEPPATIRAYLSLGAGPPQYFRPDPDFPLEKELAAQQGFDRLSTGAHKNDYRSPTPRPIADSSVPRCKDEPSEQEIRAALKRSQNVTVNCNDAEFINELLVDRLDSPRLYPLVGKAQLHLCHWKCTVCYTESIGMTWPLKIGFKLNRIAVVYIDKDRLECVGAPTKLTPERVQGGIQ